MKTHFTQKGYLSKILIVGFFAGLVLIVSFIVVFKTITPKPGSGAINISSEDTDFEGADFERNGKWYGLCPKNSIRSVEDFRRTVSGDQTLKVHYASFNWDKASMGRLSSPIPAYVYFRKGEKIFRKEKPIQLAAGDEYITDGKTVVRTYCCNEYVSGAPATEPEAPAETPPAVTESIPVPPPVKVAENTVKPLIQPTGNPLRGTTRVTTDERHPSTPVPEADTLLLLGFGLGSSSLGFFVGYWVKRRKNSSK